MQRIKVNMGERYGSLQVVGFKRVYKGKKNGKEIVANKVLCKCDCGEECIYEAYKLSSGKVTKCRRCAMKNNKYAVKK